MAREGYVQMFEEEHFSPTSEQLEEEFCRRVVNGQLKFKEKMRPLNAVHMVRAGTGRTYTGLRMFWVGLTRCYLLDCSCWGLN